MEISDRSGARVGGGASDFRRQFLDNFHGATLRNQKARNATAMWFLSCCNSVFVCVCVSLFWGVKGASGDGKETGSIQKIGLLSLMLNNHRLTDNIRRHIVHLQSTADAAFFQTD